MIGYYLSMATNYPPDWDSRRRQVYKRDGYRCQNCGTKDGPKESKELHAHHIVPKAKGGTDNFSNLQTLCKPCHDAIHHKQKMAPTADGNPDDGPFMALFLAFAIAFFWLLKPFIDRYGYWPVILTVLGIEAVLFVWMFLALT